MRMSIYISVYIASSSSGKPKAALCAQLSWSSKASNFIVRRLGRVLKPQGSAFIGERDDGLSITRKAVCECDRREAVEHRRGSLVAVGLFLLLLLQTGLLEVRRRCVETLGMTYIGVSGWSSCG